MGAIGNLAKICFTTKLGKLIDSYQEEEYRLKSGVISENAVTTTSIDNIYLRSPDMQMLMNLLAEKEGMWSAILILSIFDSNFKNQFKVLNRISCICRHLAVIVTIYMVRAIHNMKYNFQTGKRFKDYIISI